MHHLNLYTNAYWLSLVFFFFFLVEAMVRSGVPCQLGCIYLFGEVGGEIPVGIHKQNIIPFLALVRSLLYLSTDVSIIPVTSWTRH